MIGPDKFGHAAAGILIGLAAWWFTGLPIAAVAAASVAGVLKEAWDSTGCGTVDLWDFVWTAGGGGLVAAAIWMV